MAPLAKKVPNPCCKPLLFQTIWLTRSTTQTNVQYSAQYWLLTLRITPMKLLNSWMENTVIQHTFLKSDQSKKKPDKPEGKPQI